MPRPRREPLEVLTAIVQKRQPLSLRDVRYFARCYVVFSEMDKDSMYELIRENFNVDGDNKVTMRGDE